MNYLVQRICNVQSIIFNKNIDRPKLARLSNCTYKSVFVIENYNDFALCISHVSGAILINSDIDGFFHRSVTTTRNIAPLALSHIKNHVARPSCIDYIDRSFMNGNPIWLLQDLFLILFSAKYEAA